LLFLRLLFLKVYGSLKYYRHYMPYSVFLLHVISFGSGADFIFVDFDDLDIDVEDTGSL